MTLTIARVTEQGAWLAADRRGGTLAGGTLAGAGASVESFSDRCLKSFAYGWGDGHSRALIAVAGLLPPGRPMHLHANLAAASLGMPGSDGLEPRLERLRALMTEQLAPESVQVGRSLVMTVAGFSNGRPFLCYIDNDRNLAEFAVSHVGEPEIFVSGCPRAVRLSEVDDILAITAGDSPPKRVAQKFAAVIRAASYRPKAQGLVSAACTVLHVASLPAAPILRWSVSALGATTCEDLTLTRNS